MTGPEMIQEIERRNYYDSKLREHTELVECWWYAIKVGSKLGVIAYCLVSIAGHIRELWNAF